MTGVGLGYQVLDQLQTILVSAIYLVGLQGHEFEVVGPVDVLIPKRGSQGIDQTTNDRCNPMDSPIE